MLEASTGANPRQRRAGLDECLRRAAAHQLEDMVAALHKLGEDHQPIAAKDLLAFKQLVRCYQDIAQPIAAFAASPLQATRLQDLASILDDAFKQADSLARELGKGGCSFEIRVGKANGSPQFLKALTQALVHVVRNSVDHGLEKAEIRIGRHKNAQGLMEAWLDEQGQLCIRDDGSGLNLEAIAHKARQQNLAVPDKPEAIAELIFAPGFSTKAEADDISGRGVGMDAVKSFLTAVGSSISIIPEAVDGSYLKFHFAIPIIFPEQQAVKASA
jgi:hypothetical protein